MAGRPIQGRELQVGPVESRSTAGRLGLQLAVACRSTAGRPGEMRELQVSNAGRLVGEPVDRQCKTVHVRAHRSTAPLGPVDRSSGINCGLA